MATYGPEEVFAFLEPCQLVVRKCALVSKLFRRVRVVNKFGDPKQSMEIAEATLPVLQIRFNEVTAFTAFGQACVTLGQFVGHEFARTCLHDVVAEGDLHLIAELPVAANETGFEDGGENRVVGFCQPDAFLGAARGMADFQPQIPQGVEDKLNQLATYLVLFAGQQKQEINIRSRCQCAAAITTCCDDGEFGSMGIGVNFFAQKLIERPDDLILHIGKIFCALGSLAIFPQTPFSFSAT